ncbi:LysR family transcriptional regulator [Luteibacter sp. OK325]|uniref:LysR family transcriptional regulator n=1 Tax=Luteibacter sp. OK325 TaxID=2135670 RepID=UPI000D3D81F1|nr:LysR family transcriptional regulator [Luteibacter sp. OK325]PTR33949.1 LysR family transcriptional regulator [Luteibacter sp. OK325]
MDRFRAMEIFLAVLDEQGFAPAARKLRVSPPVVTRAVTELEEALGVRLLNRSTRVVRVTEIGARYATDCRRILADIAESERGATGLHATIRGTLVVTASTLFGRMRVIPIVTEFLRRYPQIDVECRFLDRVVNMIDEGVDVAVRIGPLEDSNYHAVPVGQLRRVVCASPGYLAAHGAPTTVAELADHVIIMATGMTPSYEWRFSSDGKKAVVRVHPRLTVSTNDAAIDAALDGFGVTRVASYMVAEHIASGRLVEVLRDQETSLLPIHVIYHEGRNAAQKIRAFVDFASHALREDPSIVSLGGRMD